MSYFWLLVFFWYQTINVGFIVYIRPKVLVWIYAVFWPDPSFTDTLFCLNQSLDITSILYVIELDRLMLIQSFQRIPSHGVIFSQVLLLLLFASFPWEHCALSTTVTRQNTTAKNRMRPLPATTTTHSQRRTGWWNIFRMWHTCPTTKTWCCVGCM